MGDAVTPLECLDVLVRYFYGDLRPPPEPVVPVVAVCVRGVARCGWQGTVPRRLTAWWWPCAVPKCQRGAEVRCG